MELDKSTFKKSTFRAKFGAVFEHSAWVADAVYDSGKDLVSSDTETLCRHFESVFMASAPELQLETLRAHPQLVGALADPADLTSDSAREQSGAGLDRCSRDEMKAFDDLNTAYVAKFGFPFIIAVKGRNRQAILDEFRRRLQNDDVTEYQTALRQVCQIARFRIEGMSDV